MDSFTHIGASTVTGRVVKQPGRPDPYALWGVLIEDPAVGVGVFIGCTTRAAAELLLPGKIKAFAEHWVVPRPWPQHLNALSGPSSMPVWPA